MARLISRPWLILGIIVLATVLLGPYARHKRVDNRIEDNVLQDHHMEEYRQFLTDFGNDRVLAAAIRFDTVEASLIRQVFQLEEKLQRTGLVARIVSPVSILRDCFRLDTADSLEVWLASPERVMNYTRRLHSFHSLTSSIFRPETNCAGMLITLDSTVSDTDIEGVDRLIAMIENEPGLKGRVTVTGIPEIIRVLHGYTVRDSERFTPATLLIVIIVLFVLYRSLFGVIVPLLAVVLPLAWTMGIHNGLGNATNFITAMVPPLLLGIGLTGCIHIVTRYFERSREAGEYRFETLLATVRELAAPILVCQVTTVIGFLSLAFHGLGAMRTYGIYAALGVLFSLGTTLLFIPAMIVLTRARTLRSTRFIDSRKLFTWIAGFVIRYRGRIVLFCLLLAMAGTGGVVRLGMETSLLRYLPANHPLLTRVHEVENSLFGIVPIHLVVESRGDTLETTMLGRDRCLGLAEFARQATAIADVDAAVSFVDLVQDYDREFSGEEDHLPPSALEILGYLEFYMEDPLFDELPHQEALDELRQGTGESLLWNFITRDFRRAHVTLRVRDVSSRRLEEIFAILEKLAAECLPADLTWSLTSRAYLWALTSERLVRNQVESFFLSLTLISLAIMILFRSIPVGLLALLPNVLPLLGVYGVMGYLEMNVNTVTGMLACVAIGMAVDDTIHLLHACRRGICEQGLDSEDAVKAALLEKGSSVVFTSIVIAAGFAVLLLSDFVPTARFGLLVTLTMLGALMFDLFLTPAMVLVFKPFHRSKPVEESAVQEN